MKRGGVVERRWANAEKIVLGLASEIERLEYIPVSALLHGGKTPSLAQARWAVMMVARKRGCSLPSIARALDKGDHTTVIHGLRKGEKLMRDDPGFAALVSCLEAA